MTGKNLSIQSIIKLDGLLWHDSMELKTQMLLSRDFMTEWRIAVAIKHSGFLFRSCLKVPACCLLKVAQGRTLYLPCVNTLRHQMVYSFLPARLSVRKEGQTESLGMKTYFYFSPILPGSKIRILVLYLLVCVFFYSPEKNLEKNAFPSSYQFALWWLEPFSSDNPHALVYPYQHYFSLSFTQNGGTTEQEKS